MINMFDVVDENYCSKIFRGGGTIIERNQSVTITVGIEKKKREKGMIGNETRGGG